MKSNHPHFQSSNSDIEARISAIIGKLSLEEKIDLLGGQPEPKQGGDTFGNQAAGIPPIKFADASVGVHWWTKNATAYPSTIGLAATFDRDLAYRMGAAIGRDCRARGIHVLLGPGVNLYRSPLCGRNFEYLGEDPVLAAESVVAYIRGLQDQGVAATVKHYAVNFQEYDRHNVSSDVDERTLREVYLHAFEKAIKEAGSGAVMTAYNLINGVHASEHDWLIRDVLKGEWGFDGLVMSDWISTYSAVNAANAGLDLEMPTGKWFNREQLVPAVKNGLVGESVIDDKIRRLLRLMICFGWIDHPQQDDSIPLDDPQTQAVSLEVARRSCVLLKNEGGLLPLDAKKVRTLAVIGPHADKTPTCGGGSAWSEPWRTVSILEGLRRQFGAERIVHNAGIPAIDTEAIFASSRFLTPEGKPGLAAEYFDNPHWQGTPAVVRTEERLEQRWGSGEIVPGVDASTFSARWRGVVRPEESGPHLFCQWTAAPFRVTVDGNVIFDLIDGANQKEPRVTLELAAGQDVPIEILYQGRAGFNGVCVGYKRHDSRSGFQEAIQIASRADAVVFCGGFSGFNEGEGFDRSFALPQEQEELLLALSDANPNTVAVLTAGGHIDMRRWLDRVPAVLHAWYPGDSGGQAIAEILSGAVNPSGRLPISCEHKPEDRSSFESYHDSDDDKRVLLADGVFCGYRHHDRTGVAPLFPFGYGLSYTTFAYENLRCPASAEADGTIRVSVDIVNTGARAGTEVVQLYLRDEQASVPRPFKELKDYAAVTLEPGERRTVEFVLGTRALQFFCPRRRAWVAEAGDFEILIGSSAADIRRQARFTLGKSIACTLERK
jgi:beta-glucosidase